MHKPQQDADTCRAGDKIRVRTGSHKGARGIIEAIAKETVSVRDEDGNLLLIQIDQVTNYSLAARRAWEAMPKRAGRPKLSTPRKKMVSIRIDIDIWEQLGKAVEDKLIPSREQAVNTWIRQRLLALAEKQPSMRNDVPRRALEHVVEEDNA